MVIEKLTQKFLDQDHESEKERKEKFLKYLEESQNDANNGDFNITHIPADEAKSYKLSKRNRNSQSSQKRKSETEPPKQSQKQKILEEQIEKLDLEEDPENFLKMEDYDLSQINEYQRQLNSHFDYEKLNNKSLAPVDEKILNAQFQKDSVKTK